MRKSCDKTDDKHLNLGLNTSQLPSDAGIPFTAFQFTDGKKTEYDFIDPIQSTASDLFPWLALPDDQCVSQVINGSTSGWVTESCGSKFAFVCRVNSVESCTADESTASLSRLVFLGSMLIATVGLFCMVFIVVRVKSIAASWKVKRQHERTRRAGNVPVIESGPTANEYIVETAVLRSDEEEETANEEQALPLANVADVDEAIPRASYL